MKFKTKQIIFYILFVFVILGVGLCYYNSYVNETFVTDDCITKCVKAGAVKSKCDTRCETAEKKANKS